MIIQRKIDGLYWRPNGKGYTKHIEAAGSYRPDFNVPSGHRALALTDTRMTKAACLLEIRRLTEVVGELEGAEPEWELSSIGGVLAAWAKHPDAKDDCLKVNVNTLQEFADTINEHRCSVRD